ncbi:XkdQ/YqbQ family protein, partial [Bacillus pumilus]
HTTLYHIILKPLKETNRQTCRNYRLYSPKPNIPLTPSSHPHHLSLIESRVNLIPYHYTTSIQQTPTPLNLPTSPDEQRKNNKKGSKSQIVVLEQHKA